MKRSTSRRSVRMGDQILRELSTLLMEEVKDPRAASVTLTGVRMNTDLRIAEVLFTAGPAQSGEAEEERTAKAQRGLTRAAGFLRSRLGQRLALRYLPELRFTPDDYLKVMVYARPDADDLPDH